MVEQRQQRTESAGDSTVRRNVVAVRVPRTRGRVKTQIERDKGRPRFDQHLLVVQTAVNVFEQRYA